MRKLQLCDELDRSSCGNVLFNGYLPPPGTVNTNPDRMKRQHLSVMMTSVCVCVAVYPVKRRNRHSVAGPQYMGGRAGPVERAPVRRSNTMPPNLGNAGILGRAVIEERVPGLPSLPFSILFYFSLLYFSIQFCSTYSHLLYYFLLYSILL